MRINFLFSSAFWGILLILFGLSALLRSFNINIPFGRIFFGLIIIYVGIAILSGGNIFITGQNNVFFNDIRIKVTDNIKDEYNIIFGNGVIDLTEISPENTGEEIEINTIFGSSQILISSSKPVELKATSVFGRATIPDGNTISFGDYSYSSGNTEENNPIEIEASVIFGSMEIKKVGE